MRPPRRQDPVRIRNRIGRLALLLGVPGLAIGAAIATTTPAFAVGTWCETNGDYCIGGPDTSGLAAITVSHPGRTITFNAVPGGFEGNPIGTLKTNDNTCLQALAGAGVYYNSCNADGTIWAQHREDSTHIIYINRLLTQQTSHDQDLAGACHQLNWQIDAFTLGFKPGWCQRWQ